MLNILYAPHASTRREELLNLLSSLSRAHQRVIWFVPEQQVLEAEGALLSIDSENRMEVSSFKRIANSIFRSFGGLRYHYIGKGAKYLVMWRALASVSSMLKEYKGVSSDDLSMLRLLVSTVEELKLYGVTPEQLEKAAERLEDEKLVDKLDDIALLYAAYDTVLHEKHDDASDDLRRAAAIAKGKGFFKNTHIVLDSFDGFTNEEGALLSLIFAEAEEITVTLAYDKNDSRKIFGKLRETDRYLRTLADDCKRAVTERAVARGEADPELAFFAEAIWQKTQKRGVFRPQKSEKGRGVRAVVCPGVYEETRFIAADIARRVSEGARYRDFAIIARKTDRYLGILDAALDGAGIPYFLSSRKDVTATPFVRMLFSAFDVFTYHYRTEDVIAYMRCGLSGLSAEECDLLEEYATVWRISGKRWYDDYGWQMNPFGFSAPFDEAASERLCLLNSLRERLIRPLSAFAEVFSLKPTVRAVSASLVQFLQALGIPRYLSGRDGSDAFFAGREEREETRLLYDSLLSSLDQLVEVAGDIAVSCREYSRLFYALLSEANIGKLPARSDEVTVGGADLIRKSNIRHVYVMGLLQGEFPSSELETGCFDNDEKEALASVGIETSPNIERRIADEKLYYYRAVTSAAESATLTYSNRDGEGKEAFASSALRDTLSLLGINAPEAYEDLPIGALLYASPEIYEYAVAHAIPLSGGEKTVGGELALTTPLSAVNEQLPSEVSDSLFGKRFHLSQSKMDKFALCPFAYHCTYSLKLSEGVSGNFDSLDVGNYVHSILESFFAALSGRLKTVSDEEARELLNRLVDEYVATVQRGDTSKRFASLVRRLRRTTEVLVMNLLDEFRVSDFQPAFFELPINPYEGEGVVCESIPINERQSVVLTGYVDRVDLYREGKNVYLRIVDYKTGNKTFSMKDVALGLNMQMLLYLFALSSDKTGEFAKKIGCEGEVLPAGVLYLSFGGKSANTDVRPDSAEKSRKLIESSIARSGLLLNDTKILTAMENTLEGRFLPITVNKSGGIKPSAATSFVKLEEWGALADEIQSTVKAMARELSGGKAAASPEKKGKHDPCQYCKMKPICRTAKNMTEV